MIGETVGSYRITHKLGEGGWGVVYGAEHPLIGQKVAIKLLHENMSRDADVVNRFFNEARSAAAVKHPAIIGIFDFGYHANGSAYIVMELLAGESLATRLEKVGRLPEETAIRLARQAAGALTAAHTAGIVHRDLKPDNLFLVPDAEVTGGERVKVLDFGIAKLIAEKLQGGSVKTRTGSVLGSPAYMAPEQCRGTGQIDQRADIYSLGCVVYEMLCGRPPFLGEGVGEVIAKHIYEQPENPRSLVPDLSPAVERVVLQAMSKRAEDRYASMNEMSAALDKVAGASGNANVPAVAVRATPARREGGAALAATLEGEHAKPLSTTLGEVAVEISAESTAPRRRSRLLTGVAAGAVVAALAALAVVFLTGPSKRSRSSSPTPSPTAIPIPAADPGSREPAPETEPPGDPAAETAAPVPSPPEPPTPPPVPRVTLSVTSDPPAATVYRAADGVKLGLTPYSMQLDRTAGELELLVRKPGYRDARATLSTGHDDSITLHLKPRPKHDELDPYAN